MLVVVLAIAGATPWHATVGAQGPPTAPGLDNLKTWRLAVARHVPGEFDGPAFEIAPWPQGRLEHVLAALAAAMKDAQKAVRAMPRESRAAFAESSESAGWLGLTAGELLEGDATRILKRAVVLHTDIAALVEERLRAGPADTSRAGRATSVTVLDGQFTGYGLNSDHWGFARRLLDRVRPSPQADPAVGLWYRAVAAHLVDQRAYGELKPHLDEGRQVLPRDAVLAMMAGVQHHALSSPRIQAAIATIVMSPGVSLGVGSRDAELRRARQAYQDAVRLDPGLVEARLLLGRVFADEGSPDEAVALLREAIVADDERELQDFAALFLGEQEMALGRTDEARTCFERAHALFPNAQSPLLALSHLARARGDRAGAMDALDRLTRLPSRADFDDDPWWSFLRAPGRHAVEWLDGARARLDEGRLP